ncbi:MAG: caspase family protein [Sulfuritalea sp.]|nr:caspase family protein [Sulfuritalea sp.]
MSRKLISAALFLAAMAAAGSATAQMFRPPPFMGGVPGVAQFQAIQMQRHQARTLLYREALEELRKNPAAADVPECPVGQDAKGGQCLARAKPEAAAPAAPQLRRRFAVLVGNNAYPAPIPPLETPIADVSRIAGVLQTRFGFEVRVIKDAGKASIIEALNKVAAEAGPDDSVLLMYAGHGYLLDEINMGYWIPVDGSVKTAQGWISNGDISKLLSAIRARQLILISDSCYSGSLTKEQKVTPGKEINPEEVLKQRSVLVLSSGDDEPVSDEGKEGHSIFAWNLIKTLRSTGGITPGTQVWNSVRTGVSKEYPQRPQYGAVVSAGHAEGGDFLFQMPR